MELHLFPGCAFRTLSTACVDVNLFFYQPPASAATAKYAQFPTVPASFLPLPLPFLFVQPPDPHLSAGMVYITDDTGVVCNADDVDGSTGCCSVSGDDRFPCTTCDPRTDCCRVYEYCVACCMHPHRQLKSLNAIRQRHKAKVPLYMKIGENDTFAFCRAKCRTDSGSTVHENQYKSDFHFCFSQ